MTTNNLLLVPYCIRNPLCTAQETDGELICQRERCPYYNQTGCQVYTATEEAERRGIKVLIIKHDDSIPDILAREKPRQVLGLPCRRKGKLITSFLEARGIKSDYVCLDNEACFKTTGVSSRVPFEKLKELLDKYREN